LLAVRRLSLGLEEPCLDKKFYKSKLSKDELIKVTIGIEES
jgi:hypothetical protein